MSVTDGDEPEVGVWRGHPGVVVDVALDADGKPWDVSVALVAGPSISGVPSAFEQIEESDYRARGSRIIAGVHPVEDRPIGPYVAAPGHEWPHRP